jgi:predicted transcriptional regulator
LLYSIYMTNMTMDAIEALRNLPKERQETAARAILEFASYVDDVYHLTEHERREVRAGLAEIERGEIANDREVSQVMKQIGL